MCAISKTKQLSDNNKNFKLVPSAKWLNTPETFLKYFLDSQGKKRGEQERLFTVSEACAILGKPANWKKFNVLSESIYTYNTFSTITSTIVGISYEPFSQTIKHDRHGYFIEGVSKCPTHPAIVERLYLPTNFYKEIKMQTGMVIVERGVTPKKLRPNHYAYYVAEKNNLRLIQPSTTDDLFTTSYKSLFGDIEGLKPHIEFEPKNTQVGVVAIELTIPPVFNLYDGHVPFFAHNLNKHVLVHTEKSRAKKTKSAPEPTKKTKSTPTVWKRPLLGALPEPDYLGELRD